MKEAILCILGLLLALPMASQKEDYNWVLGNIISKDSLLQTAIMNFNHKPVSIEYINKSLGIDFISSTLSDSSGNLTCFSNGSKIFNCKLEVIPNADKIFSSDISLPFGVDIQSMIIIPLSNKNYLFFGGDFVFHYLKNGFVTGCLSPMFYYEIVFEDHCDKGVVRKQRVLVERDTAHKNGITAVRHANGRDWWIITHKPESNVFKSLLVQNGHVSVYRVQAIGEPLPYGWDHAVFSPDGRWYARYSWWGKTGPNGFGYSDLYLYNFDRCTGELSNFRKHRLKDDGPGGVAISPNSRYLYVSNWDTIFQYDLHAPDIFSTETVVAGYDAFRDERGWRVRFFTPQLAPDGRIYICVPNVSSRYLHYIEFPDSAGFACKVVQHGIKLPIYNSNTLPNLPYFRLYEEKGSPCDTIWKGKREDYAGIILHPNPGGTQVNLRIPGDGLERSGQLNMYSAVGGLVLSMPLLAKTVDHPIDASALSTGLYFYEVLVSGKRVFQGKWIKLQN